MMLTSSCDSKGRAKSTNLDLGSPAERSGFFFAMKRLTQYDVHEVPIPDIFYDATFNCRGEFTLDSCADLADSIATRGLDFPVVVQPIDKPGYRFRLIAGHRRYTAITRFLKWEMIPANIRDLTESEARMLNFTENLERKDLNILEEARWIANYYPEGASLRHISKELKRDTRWVHVRLRLLKLPDEIQKMAAADMISSVDIEVISNQPDDIQLQAANEIIYAKKIGKSYEVGNKYGKKFRYRKTKEQLNAKIAEMLNLGLSGGMPRALTWAAGYISDEEFDADIAKELCDKHQESAYN